MGFQIRLVYYVLLMLLKLTYSCFSTEMLLITFLSPHRHPSYFLNTLARALLIGERKKANELETKVDLFVTPYLFLSLSPLFKS